MICDNSKNKVVMFILTRLWILYNEEWSDFHIYISQNIHLTDHTCTHNPQALKQIVFFLIILFCRPKVTVFIRRFTLSSLYYIVWWPVEVFSRQSKNEDKLAFDKYQVRSLKGSLMYWLLISLVHLIACTGCGEAMSFEDGYAFIYSHIQEERFRFICQYVARHALFEDVLALVT